MQFALELAARGRGWVEPNPPVGAVIVDDELNLVGQGWHQRYGAPHAEINALASAADSVAGQTLIVTLEPCCHAGQTGPCSEAVIQSGVRRVVIGTRDPAPHVDGGGIKQLRAAGLEVEVGVCAEAARELIAPFVTLQLHHRPWVIGKWAMSLDGKIATCTGHSQWISSTESRERVHALRARVDGILVGIQTALADDPQLTARPAGPRTPVRIVLDRHARLPVDGKLARTADQIPVLLVHAAAADPAALSALRECGVETWECPLDQPTSHFELATLLRELGRRSMTNLLVEGGGRTLGAFHDQQFLDELHCFIAPKLIGGAEAVSPLSGVGSQQVASQPQVHNLVCEKSGPDVYLRGRVRALSEIFAKP